MNIVKFDSYDLEGLFNWDSLLDRFLNNKTGEIYEPFIRFDEDEEWYILNMDLSGIKKKNIHVYINDNRTIEITAKKYKKFTKSALGNKTRSVYFKRTFVIPYDADETDITWKIEKGILRVYVGKLENKPENESFNFCRI